MDRILGVPERFLYRVMRVDAGQRPGLEGLRQEPDHLLARRLAAALLHPAHADAVELDRAQPAGLPLGAVERHVQHHVVVRDQHQLAVLRRRDDDELLQPDGRADGSELPLGGRRHRRRRRAHPRDHRAAAARAWATSGRTWSAPSCTCCCRSRSSVALVLVSQGVDPELRALPDGARDHRPHAVDRDGPRRLAGGDQGARHQRRRLLQRQLRAPVREPDRVHQPRRDAARCWSSRPRWCSCTAGWSATAARATRSTRR